MGGEFNELLNVMGIIPIGADLVPDSGIYMCEVCTDRGTQSEECHTANVTLHIIGGSPLIDKAVDSGIPIYMHISTLMVRYLNVTYINKPLYMYNMKD